MSGSGILATSRGSHPSAPPAPAPSAQYPSLPVTGHGLSSVALSRRVGGRQPIQRSAQAQLTELQARHPFDSPRAVEASQSMQNASNFHIFKLALGEVYSGRALWRLLFTVWFVLLL